MNAESAFLDLNVIAVIGVSLSVLIGLAAIYCLHNASNRDDS